MTGLRFISDVVNDGTFGTFINGNGDNFHLFVHALVCERFDGRITTKKRP